MKRMLIIFVCILYCKTLQIHTPAVLNTTIEKPRFNHQIKYTSYYPDAGHENPSYLTASGLKISNGVASKRNIVALSRDIIRKYDISYGDTICIKFDSDLKIRCLEYHDKMNVRFKNKIDILIPLLHTPKNGTGMIVNIKRKVRV